MRITRSMLHADLQPFFHRACFLKILAREKWLVLLTDYLTKKALINKPSDRLNCEEVYIQSNYDTWQIRTKIYKPKSWRKREDVALPLMLYFHGGGYIMGCPESYANVIESYIAARPCIVIAPDYRKAYTQPYPAGFNDCYDTLLWAFENAESLGANSQQIIVAGHSAGGGMTAAVTLRARDESKVPISFQMPIYPMIDDRQPYDPGRYIEAPVWDSTTNCIGWNAYLSRLQDSGSLIPATAAPARNTDYRDFPPTISYIGTFDPFLEETRNYIKAIAKEGIDVIYKEYERCFHGSEYLLPNTAISKEMREFSIEAYTKFYDRYLS